MSHPWRALGAALVCLPLVLTAGERATAVQSLQDLFDSYSTGHEASAITAVLDHRVATPAAADMFFDELQTQIDTWPRESAAAFALESARAALFREAARPGEFERHSHFGDIVELACRTLERSEPTSFDQQWYLASIAVLTGPPSDMQGGSTLASLHPGSPRVAALDALRRHLLQRNAADPALSLAWGTTREAEVQAWLYSWATSLRLQPDRPIPRQTRTEDVHRWLDDASASFETARHDPALRAEATVRLGLTRMYQGHVDEALGLWNEMPALNASAAVRYLASLFTARTLGVSGRRADAIAAYRQAMALQPGAQSALIPLAALLYLSDERGEAAALVSPLMSATAAGTDPWSSYTDQHMPDRIAAMRRAVPR